jgi:hypothetical protein
MLVVLVSCRPKTATVSELNLYLTDPEHGLSKTLAKEDIKLELIYRPRELVFIGQAGADKVKREARLDSMDYFVLRLSRSGKVIEHIYGADQSEYNRVIGYLDGELTKDISLQYDGTLIHPEGVALMPSVSGTDASTIMLVFKSALQKYDGQFTVIFNDSMFGTGRTDFEFNSRDIKRVPSIRM